MWYIKCPVVGILDVMFVNYFCNVEINFYIYESSSVLIDTYSLIKQINYETSYLLHYSKSPVW